MIKFKGEVVFKNGKSILIDREIPHNGDLPYVVIEETIKELMKDGAVSRKTAILETCILLDYDESSIRRTMSRLGI